MRQRKRAPTYFAGAHVDTCARIRTRARTRTRTRKSAKWVFTGDLLAQHALPLPSPYFPRTRLAFGQMDDKRVNEGKIPLFPSLFFSFPEKPRCVFPKTYHPESVFILRLIYFRLPHTPSTTTQSFASLLLSLIPSLFLSVFLPRLVYTPSVGPSIPLRQKEFMNEERSPRDASGTGGDSLLPSLLRHSGNNRRIHSTGLVLGMSCE